MVNCLLTISIKVNVLSSSCAFAAAFEGDNSDAEESDQGPPGRHLAGGFRRRFGQHRLGRL